MACSRTRLTSRKLIRIRQHYNGKQVDTVLASLADDGDTVLNFPRPRPHFRVTGADAGVGAASEWGRAMRRATACALGRGHGVGDSNEPGAPPHNF
jgi:hypothetical protein